MQEERLTLHLQDRPAQLREAKEKGIKIIGYFPGNYVPEELIIAAGSVPICLIDGGDTQPLEASLPVMPHIFCPFARTQIGERLLKRNPYYDMIDMFVAPITCQHLKKVAEIWEYYGDIEIFKLGVPHQGDNDFELEYFTDRLKALKDRLEALTGNEITAEGINTAIELYNRMRGLLKKISLMRRDASVPFDALDFVKLNHASYYADPTVMVDILESASEALQGQVSVAEEEAPRLLLIGPNIGYGDYKMLELVTEAGGSIVIEEIYEGMRYYWSTIDTTGDPLHALARGYLRERVPPAFMRYSTRKRLDFVLKLIADFKVSGVIWYELLGCETYDAESYYFSQKMEEQKIPMLILESDYGMAGVGQMKIRIEAFIEMVKGGLD
ncbi:MAG TPA: 2-hydroxyacyl-CoA dehydratase [Chloroflexi bacterium]|nr:2-hydroxyacyl-CoA dehydratase [Chloroflexota bacterium]